MSVRAKSLREWSRSRWGNLREQVLRRDNGLCQCERCKSTGALRLATEVDHIIPIHKGGADSGNNLQAINVECHKLKTAAEQGKRRRPLVGLDGYPCEGEP
jgi:5-methylcytosine-specific restriction protein A